MNRVKITLPCAAFFVVCLLNLTNAFAQNPLVKAVEPSYEIQLQTVVASNNSAEKSSVPPTLAGIVKKLKSDFPFSEYRLTSTLMQRVSDNGYVEFKGVSYETAQNKNAPVFIDWTIKKLHYSPDENARDLIQIDDFRFGQRIPLTNSSGSVNYESIGVATKFSLPKNAPTVVGTLATGKSDELMFLILTVKSVEK